MKNTKMKKIILMLALPLIITACEKAKDGDRITIQEPGKTITIIDDGSKETGEPIISVVKIDRYENVAITDWLNENTVIVSKENTSLDKLSLLELSDSYPRSLYLYNINTEEYQLLKEQKDVNLGGATLSSDKKNLLYYEFTLGDPSFYVMNMGTLKTFGITGADIAGAMGAKWADNETIIGAAYSGGAYIASTSGEITSIDELKDESLVIVEKIKNHVYYNTNSDESLWRLDLSSKEKVSLNMSHVHSVFPSPDGNQILAIQSDGAKKTLALYDRNGGNRKIIAEGAELEGVSWSPDQRMIAYKLKADVNGRTVDGLYIHDLLTGDSTQIAVDIQYLSTSWSPSGKELVYTEWDGKQYNSSIVYLNYSLRK
ncbi:TolB family protein [Alkaliphilus crotonatoxidans]